MEDKPKKKEKMFSLSNTKPFVTMVKTIVLATFLITGTIAALSLRGDLQLQESFKVIIGNITATFVLAVLFNLIYKSNK